MSQHRTERPHRRALRTTASALAALTLLLGWSAATGSTAYAQEASAPATAPTAANSRAVEVRGGDILYGSGGIRCNVGFNAHSGTATYGMMPGHCALGSTNWYADAARTIFVGTTAGSSFPSNDYSVISYVTGVNALGEVGLGPGGGVQDIVSAANPTVGQSICHVGGTTGIHCGTVTGTNVTINYPEGMVSGLFSSNICSEPGDVGGPGFSGTTALGIIVASSGSCASGGVTYYQPVVEWLSAYGLSIY